MVGPPRVWGLPVVAGAIGALIAALLWVAPPAGLAPAATRAAMLVAVVWSPWMGIVLSIVLVGQSVEERTATPDAIEETLAPLGLERLDPVA